MLDDIAQAVLAREEVVKYLRGGLGEARRPGSRTDLRYLEELRTTQRHAIYRALQHPLYPILRKIERKHENLHHVGTPSGTTDGLRVEPQEPHRLSGRAARARRQRHPPAAHRAGINLFGGPLG
jgi:hypothetical protein